MELAIDTHVRINVNDLPEDLRRRIETDLTMDNPAYDAALKAGRVTRYIPTKLSFFSYQNRQLIIPRGYLPRLREYLAGVALTVHDRRLLLPPTGFGVRGKLRDYQEPAVQAATAAGSGVIVSPCGSGKTVMGIELIRRCRQPALWVTHTKELVDQTLDRFEEFTDIPRQEIGYIGGGKVRLGERVTVGLVQTLIKQDLRELGRQFGLVLVDECQHVPSTTFTQVVTFFPASYRYGLTATPYRADGMGPVIAHIIGPEVARVEHQELAQANQVMLPQFRRIKTNYQYDYSDDYSALLGNLVANWDRNNLIASDVIQEARAGHYCLVLSKRIEHCELLKRRICDLAPELDVEVLVGALAKFEREDVMARARAKQVQIILATQVADEGLDLPHLDRLFLATPAAAEAKVTQQVGRIMRPAPGKRDAIVYDFVDEQVGVLKAQSWKRHRVFKKLAAAR